MAEADHEHKRLKMVEDETRARAKLVASLQCGGAVSIIFARALYGEPWDHSFLFFGVGAVAMGIGLAFLFLALHEAFASRVLAVVFRNTLDQNAVERSDVMTSLCYWMVMMDCLLCGMLIVFSGGFLGSFYAPLLIGVASTSLALRLPKRMLIEILVFAIMLAVGSEWLFGKSSELASWIGVDFAEFLPPKNNEYHHRALLLTTAMTVLLTVLGGFEIFLDPGPRDKIDKALHSLKGTSRTGHLYMKPIQLGIQWFAKDCGRKSGDVLLGCVHDLQTIIEQSIILMYPYDAQLERGRTKSRRQHRKDIHDCAMIAYLAFAAHWIDDFFDHKFLSRSIDMTQETSKILANSRHLKRLRKAILRRMIKGRKQDRKERIRIVDRALLRIMLGGKIQHAANALDLDSLMRDYRTLVVNGLPDHEFRRRYQDLIGETRYRIILWGTAKNVLDLFDCCQPGSDPVFSEAYTLLFTPILICQNLDSEVEMEGFSEEFSRGVCDVNQMLDLCRAGPDVDEQSQLLITLRSCVDWFEGLSPRLHKSREATVVAGRRRQLRALLDIYGTSLPKPLAGRYESLWKNERVWQTS